MNVKLQVVLGCAALAAMIGVSSVADAQERTLSVSPRPNVTPSSSVSSRALVYHATREITVVGTVLEFRENSTTPPIGAHVTVQAGSGKVDVHLGPSSFLRANNFSLAPGDSVRFIGAMATARNGSVFLARIAQKGTQAIAVRSPQGFLLAPAAGRVLAKEQRAQAAQKAGAR